MAAAAIPRAALTLTRARVARRQAEISTNPAPTAANPAEAAHVVTWATDTLLCRITGVDCTDTYASTGILIHVLQLRFLVQ